MTAWGLVWSWSPDRPHALDRSVPGAYVVVVDVPPKGDVYVNEPWLSIRWDSVHRHVHSEWSAFATSVELRAAMLRGIQAISDHQAAAYVSDAKKLKVIVHEDQKWIKETWMPLAIEAGLNRLAFVTAATGLAKLDVEDVVASVNDHGLQSRTFDSMAAARKWVSEAS